MKKYSKEIGVILFLGLSLMLLSAVVFSKHKPSVLGAVISSSSSSKTYYSAPTENLLENRGDHVVVPVFMYHHIGDMPTVPDKYSRDLTVSTEDFTKQVEYLKQAGYKCISTTELFKYAIGQLKLTAKPCVITLDDGFADAFNNGVPVLVKNGMVGSFAIITRYVGTPQYADWQLIKNAQDKGMDIIAHSQHHIDFTSKKYSLQEKTAEVQGSMADIKENLGTIPLAFVYPYGDFDATAEKIVKDSGFKMAFTTKFGLYDNSLNQFEMPRVRVHGVEDLQLFKKILNESYYKQAYKPISKTRS